MHPYFRQSLRGCTANGVKLLRLETDWRPSGQGSNQLRLRKSSDEPKPSSECVLESFENRRPFYVLYDTQKIRIDSHFIDGLAGDNSGNLYDVEFSSMGWSTEALSGGLN